MQQSCSSHSDSERQTLEEPLHVHLYVLFLLCYNFFTLNDVNCVAVSPYAVLQLIPKATTVEEKVFPQVRTPVAGFANNQYEVFWTQGNDLLLVPSQEEGEHKVNLAVWSGGLLSDDLLGEAELELDYKELLHKRILNTTLDKGGEVELCWGWADAPDAGGKSRAKSRAFSTATNFSASQSRAYSNAAPLTARESKATFLIESNRSSEISPNASTAASKQTSTGRGLFQASAVTKVLSPGSGVKQGTVLKLSNGVMKRWQKRVLVLSAKELKMTKKHTDLDKPKSRVVVELADILTVEVVNANKFEFHVRVSHGPTLKLRCGNAQEVEEWVALLKSCNGVVNSAKEQARLRRQTQMGNCEMVPAQDEAPFSREAPLRRRQWQIKEQYLMWCWENSIIITEDICKDPLKANALRRRRMQMGKLGNAVIDQMAVDPKVQAAARRVWQMETANHTKAAAQRRRQVQLGNCADPYPNDTPKEIALNRRQWQLP